MTERDWKRVETELDELLPGVSGTKVRQVPDQPLQPADQRADENFILKHIAHALQLDTAEIS